MTSRSDTRAIAIVGMGGRFPGSPHVRGFWETIRSGRVCATPVGPDKWRHELFLAKDARDMNRTYAAKMATIDDPRTFAPEFFNMTPRRAKVMDPQQRLFLEATRMAFEDAGYARRPFPRERTGVFVGASVSDFMDLMTSRVRAWQLLGGQFGAPPDLDDEGRKALTEGLVSMQAYSMVGTLMNMVAANVSQAFDLGGPSFTSDAACSSALVALDQAVQYLRAGLCDAAVVGGAYMVFTPDNFVAFARIGALSLTDACRPYDARADGFVIGEAIGAVVLKRLEDAHAAGDHVHAIIRGVASNSDGKAEGPMTPRREGQLACLEAAYEDAAVAPRTLAYLEGHGTATPVGDATEIAAFRDLLERQGGGFARPTPLGSVKANIGHTLSAAGIAGLIKAVLVLRHRTIPPQANWAEPRAELELERAGLYVPTATAPLVAADGAPLRVGVNAFGFGGTNVHVVLDEAPRPERAVQIAVPATLPVAPAATGPVSVPATLPTTRANGAAAPASVGPAPSPVTTAELPQLIVLSAPTPALLATSAEETAAALGDLEPGATLAAVAHTLGLRRADPARLAFVAGSLAEAAQVLGAAAVALRNGSELPAGVRYAAAPRPPEARRLAFLFPGQGLQSPGLCRDLFERYPSFASDLERLCAGATDLPRPLLEYLYPPAGVDPAAAEAALTATEVCQPAVAAVGLALARFLERLGGKADVTLGHSLGEFAAAAGAGLISDDLATIRFVARRGRLIAEASLTDPGAMAAVAADRATVEALIASVPGVVLANLNHPRQVVISGPTASVDAAEARIAAAGHKTTRLRVSHAFHSPLMASIGDALAPALAELPLAELPLAAPGLPPRTGPSVVSAITTAVYPETVAEIRHVFREHATSRVDFGGALERAAEPPHGARVFVQLGAGSALVTMARATLEGRHADLVAFPLTGATPDQGRSFLQALGHLFVLGVPLALEALHTDHPPLVAMLPPSRLDGRPLWPINVAQSTVPVTQPTVPRSSMASREDAAPSSPATVSPATAAPAPLAASAEADTGLAAVFRQQLAVIDAHLAILRQQNELLARAGVSPEALASLPLATASSPQASSSPTTTPTTLAAPTALVPAASTSSAVAPSPTNGHVAKAVAPAPKAGTSQGELESKVTEVVAKITAIPPARLKPTTKLGSDLGFDSLMVVELVTGLQDALPGSEALPRALFAEDASIADVARHLLRSLATQTAGKAADKTGKAAPTNGAGGAPEMVRPISRYAVAWRPTPATALGTSPSAVWIVGEGAGLAAALEQRLARQPIAVHRAASIEALAKLTPAEALRSAVVDLRAISPMSPQREPLPGAEALLDSALGAFALAQALDARRPAQLLFAHRGESSLASAGVAKSLGREWTETRVGALELTDPSVDASAEALLAELLTSDASPEVRHASGTREVPWLVPSLAPRPATARPTLPEGAVVVVSGGGGGLGAKLALALAQQAHARLVLLGRRPSDATVETTLAAIRAAGGDALYVACDVRDPAAVAAALAEGRRRFGAITHALHAAGVVEDAPLGRKTAESVRRVFETKIAGALALWQALHADPLRSFVALGSWAGRFGNAHQIDYGAANHTLARLTERFGGARPATHVVTLALPPWEGSTMVAGVPELVRAEMKRRGVTFLDDTTGVSAVVNELATSAGPAVSSGEIVLGADLPSRAAAALVHVPLSVQSHPYLDDHRIGDRPVLPMAAALDLMRDASRAVHPATVGSDGVSALLDVAVTRGVILSDGRAEIAVRASATQAMDGAFTPVSVELLTLGPRPAVAYRGQIARASGWLPPLPATREPTTSATLTLDEFYGRHTFHGPLMRAVEAVAGLGPTSITGSVRAGSVGADRATAWLLGLDGALQLCAYWAAVHHGRVGVPVGFDELRAAGEIRAGARLRCHAQLRVGNGNGDGGGHGNADGNGSGAPSDPGRFSGDLDLVIEGGPQDGQPVLQLRGLRAELLAPTDRPALDPSQFKIDEFPEVKELRGRLEFARVAGIVNPYFRTLDACTGATALIDGREYANFTSYNYVGLSGDPRITPEVTRAVSHYGTSVSASRVTGGQKPIHAELEQEISSFLGTEATIVMVGGHATNVSVVGHIVGAEDLVLHDSLAHDSILGGARLAGARRRPFPHNDVAALERILQEVRGSVRRVLIAVEGVYSMDGDIAPLPEIIALKKKYGCLLLVDEAHSLGVLGATGRGVGEYFGVDRRDVDMWMGTMSKTLASCGGYIAGSAALIEYLKYTTPGFIYSVGMTPANAAAALTALRILTDEPERARICQERSRLFLELCKARGVDTGDSRDSAVIPCIVGNSYASIKLAEALLARGVHVHPIVYPAVADNLSRLRFFVTAAHSEAQLRMTADALAEEMAKLGLLTARRTEGALEASTAGSSELS